MRPQCRIADCGQWLPILPQWPAYRGRYEHGRVKTGDGSSHQPRPQLQRIRHPGAQPHHECTDHVC
ncbi:hypothetical protein BD779DRAFT_1515855 [Infundibulicybe gibba]|nr:hypothetical protein BD779DRAFT_1515855 [Infundibulicybe gibba]